MYSRKKLVLFGRKPLYILSLKRLKHILSMICFLSVLVVSSQEKDKALLKSNALIYEANKIVSEDFVEAEKEYRKAISKKQTNTPGSYNLGNAYYEAELFDEALLRHVESAKNASTKTERHKAFHNIGNALMQQQQCKEAVEAYKNALRNDPTDEETRYNLALAKECEQNQGEGDDGEKDQKEDEKNQEQENQDQENKDQKDQGDENEDNQDQSEENEDQNEGDEKEDENGKPKDEQDNKNNDPKNQKKQQQQPGKLSPQQVKSLLEAMNNEEKKVQEKINARKAKGAKVKREKDW